MKVIKILFLQGFPLQGSGSGIYTRELASELQKDKNIKVAVASAEGREKVLNLKIYPLEIPFPVAFSGHPDWPVCRLYKDLSPKEIISVFRSFLNSVVNVVEDFKPDIIHVQHISLLLWAANFIKSLYGINFVVTTHGTCIIAAKANKNYVSLSQDALRRARRIIAVSKDNKKEMLSVFGNEFAKKTSTITSGIKLENFPAEKQIKIINKKYSLEGKKVILFVGKLTNLKGTEYLIMAAKEIKGDIYIIGDGPEKKNLEDLIRELSLDNVHLLGYMGDDKREELTEFYYRADVFVAPSVTEEALGLVILEAMACYTPVIATRKGGIPSIIKDGFNGFLIRSKNSKQIAEYCNKIIHDDQLRKKMKMNARSVVEEKFNWMKTVDKYIRIYRRAYSETSNHAKKNEKSSDQNNNQGGNQIETIKI